MLYDLSHCVLLLACAYRYDFHGICDLVLLDNKAFDDNTGMEIQVRTKPRYQYSYIEAAAIKLGNDILEVGPWGEYW